MVDVTELPVKVWPRQKLVIALTAAAIVAAMAVASWQFDLQTAKKDAGPKAETKGALPRWLKAVAPLWQGKDIYSVDSPDSPVHLHPNIPVVPILLTPLARLSPRAAAAIVNLLKILLVLASLRMLWEVAAHKLQPPAAWAVALGVLWAMLAIVADVQHGNTNTIVLAGISLHLWLYRRGRDLLAGSSLALAICLKMTPALFVLYWLYQRNWKLLGGVLIALVVLGVIIPAAALGPSHACELTDHWLHNLIVPGLMRNSPYPVHINQSLPAMMNRFFLPEGDKGGNVFWNPDDVPNYPGLDGMATQVGNGPQQRQWVTLVSLSPWAVQWITRAAQMAIVGLMACAIGWRLLPRDDARRGLQYGMVVLGMLLLNQRTWEEHAAVLLVATIPIWLAIGFGRMGRAARKWRWG